MQSDSESFNTQSQNFFSSFLRSLYSLISVEKTFTSLICVKQCRANQTLTMIFFIPFVLADCDESIFLTITWRFVPKLPGEMLLSLNVSFLYVFMFNFQFHLDNFVIMGLFGLGTIQLG